jgi:ribosome-associated protein
MPEDRTHQPDMPESMGGLVRLAPGVEIPGDCLRFAFSRSSGPGGQNVNKRSTKAELRVALSDLPMHPGAKDRLVALARGYMTSEGEVLIVCDEHRSQPRNREACVRRLATLVAQAQVVPKVRRKTKPSRGAKERRLQSKKRRGDIKRGRGGDGGGGGGDHA